MKCRWGIFDTLDFVTLKNWGWCFAEWWGWMRRWSEIPFIYESKLRSGVLGTTFTRHVARPLTARDDLLLHYLIQPAATPDSSLLWPTVQSSGLLAPRTTSAQVILFHPRNLSANQGPGKLLSQSDEHFQACLQAPLTMAPDISPGRVLLLHLRGGTSCGAGQEADSKGHSHLLHQYQSETPVH